MTADVDSGLSGQQSVGRPSCDPVHKPKAHIRVLTKEQSDLVPALAHRPATAARLMSIKKTKLYEMISRGEIAAKKIGGATVILQREIDRVLEAAPALPVTKPRFSGEEG